MTEVNYKQIKEGEIGKEANPIILEVLKAGGRAVFKMEKGTIIIRTTTDPEIIKKIDELTKIG
ncbi:protein of unknown function [endosymbiont DhMRE of Dentiscutata heterogama]|uniref:hypothetical protein n=1 Tax=endosymbiont DhMRE of Dentiscutata heterogama TaxID=1609546 RepID=UPI000629DA24|nr:hypothetical protein [endosymbiont DhMRE of Dentiscutata heterogama]CFW93284.1 protein of unknown function [endosymbiont DhMRE of Dentiscutata heterogama]